MAPFKLDVEKTHNYPWSIALVRSLGLPLA